MNKKKRIDLFFVLTKPINTTVEYSAQNLIKIKKRKESNSV